MAQALQPTVLPPCLPSSLLDYVLEHCSPPTTLLVCSTRAGFLSSLLQAIKPAKDSSPSGTTEGEALPEPEIEHPLLIPTLQQISTSRDIHTVFLPTVSHLRAYLAVHDPGKPNAPGKDQSGFHGSENRVPLLIVYGLVALHRDTSEWAAQGLGSSMASLVDAGFRAKQRILIMEEKLEDMAGHDDDEQDIRSREDHDRRKRQDSSWLEEQMPMLNGSTRRMGMESGDGWSGRTVDVRRVLSRWCRLLRNP